MIKRYCVVGVSNRALSMFMDTIRNEYSRYAELVGMLDTDKSRMESYNRSRGCSIPMYFPEQFDKMVKEEKPDCIIVACRDCDHDEYVVKALEHNLDVISEKPLTTDEHKCERIVKAAAKSKGKVTVTFNYRYTPHTTKIRELIKEGKIGRVVSLDLNWYLDTYHGASYFQRWNRQREFSGGLSVHKTCHHLDLVRWWIDQHPVEVFAYGARNFYGPEGVHNPLNANEIGDGRTCPTCDKREKCKYYMRYQRDELRGGSTYGRVGKIDDHVDHSQTYQGYNSRQCIFDPQIDIEDTYSAVIKYDNGAFLNYSLNGSMPYEGFRLGINGTEGRIEMKELHGGDSRRFPFPIQNNNLPTITYIPLFGGREVIDVINLGGGHGGGDPLMRDELFIGRDPLNKVERMAELSDGIEAVLTGVALYKSVQSGTAVSIDSLKQQVYSPKIDKSKTASKVRYAQEQVCK